MGDGVKEACGLFGVFGDPSAAHTAYLGSYAQQHRGMESCGISSTDGHQIYVKTGMGLVPEVFSKKDFANGNGSPLEGYAALGHVRYSTTGDSSIKNAQPLVVPTLLGEIALAHNGNLTNAVGLKEKLMSMAPGLINFATTTDSEVIGKLIARSQADNLEEAIIDAFSHPKDTAKGAYSLLILNKDAMYVIRDPNAFRPLFIGRKGKSVIAASEPFAFTVNDATYDREVKPGELIVVNKDTMNSDPGYRSIQLLKSSSITQCVFEGVYYARPDHVIKGVSVSKMRLKFGHRLAQEYPVGADIVTPIPDSGNFAAVGYSEESGIRYMPAYVRSHHVGRTFMLPHQSDREVAAKIKLAVIPELVKDKRVIVVDDSIVRGTTSKNRIQLLWDAGAKEVHLRISCPPTRHPCFYGFDFSTYEELIAHRKGEVEEIRKHVGATTLGYLSLEGMLEIVGKDGNCTACWDGNYPVDPEDFKAGRLKKGKC